MKEELTNRHLLFPGISRTPPRQISNDGRVQVHPARLRGTCFEFSRVGLVLDVRKTTKRSSSGSTQMDVPVKPVCPNARSVKKSPLEDPRDGVSHPRALDDEPSKRWVNRSTVVGATMRTGPGRGMEQGTPVPGPLAQGPMAPPPSSVWANTAMSLAEEKRPAWPATPPMA